MGLDWSKICLRFASDTSEICLGYNWDLQWKRAIRANMYLSEWGNY